MSETRPAAHMPLGAAPCVRTLLIRGRLRGAVQDLRCEAVAYVLMWRLGAGWQVRSEGGF